MNNSPYELFNVHNIIFDKKRAKSLDCYFLHKSSASLIFLQFFKAKPKKGLRYSIIILQHHIDKKKSLLHEATGIVSNSS